MNNSCFVLGVFGLGKNTLFLFKTVFIFIERWNQVAEGVSQHQLKINEQQNCAQIFNQFAPLYVFNLLRHCYPVNAHRHATILIRIIYAGVYTDWSMLDHLLTYRYISWSTLVQVMAWCQTITWSSVDLLSTGLFQWNLSQYINPII